MVWCKQPTPARIAAALRVVFRNHEDRGKGPHLDSYHQRMKQYYQTKYSRLGFSREEIDTIIISVLEDR